MKNVTFAIAMTSILLIGCVQNSAQSMAVGSRDVTVVERKVFTPSGDWGGHITYTYGKDGKLQLINYEFCTLNGYDKANEKFSPTRCVRKYDVSHNRQLLLKSKVTTDLVSGQKIDRSFYEPEISHWMTIAEARKRGKN